LDLEGSTRPVAYLRPRRDFRLWRYSPMAAGVAKASRYSRARRRSARDSQETAGQRDAGRPATSTPTPR
jgi:hypothetical protein